MQWCQVMRRNRYRLRCRAVRNIFFKYACLKLQVKEIELDVMIFLTFIGIKESLSNLHGFLSTITNYSYQERTSNLI